MWEFDFKDVVELQPQVERLLEKKAKLDNARPLQGSALRKINENLSLEWTYNSNSIEGNTLNLRETQLILQNGITVGGKSLREHFEVINHERAIDYIYNLVDSSYKLSAVDILSLHGLIMKNVEEDFAGRLRNGGVRIFGANFTPPNANKVAVFFDELIDFVNDNPLRLDDLLLTTVFHHKLVWIHPFFDGNGRTVRLAMNLILMRKGYPPAIILKNDRNKYYEALNQANNGNYQKLFLLTLQAVERSLNIYIGAMPGNGYDYQTISNIVAEPAFPYGQEYVSLLARQGKIDAYKEGRNWLTSKSAVLAYMSTQKRNK